MATGAMSGATNGAIEIEKTAVRQVAGHEIEVEESAVLLLQGDEVEVEQSAVFALAARSVEIEQSTTVFLLAQRVTGDVKTLFDWKSALALGAGWVIARRLLRLLRLS